MESSSLAPRVLSLSERQEPARAELNKVAKLLGFFALGVAAIGVVNFYYLAMADIPVTEDNPNPPKMSDFSRWTSIVFHFLLYRNIGVDLIPKVLGLPKAFINIFRPGPRAQTTNMGLFLLKSSIPALFYYYICSLFAAMPSIALIQASEFAGTPDAWVKSLLVIQLALLFGQVDQFAGKFRLGFHQIMSNWRPTRWYYADSNREFYRLVEEIRILIEVVEKLSVCSSADQKLLLQIVMGRTLGGAVNSEGLIQRSGANPQNGVLGAWTLDADPDFGRRHLSYQSLVGAIQSIAQHLHALQTGKSGSAEHQPFARKCGSNLIGFAGSLGLGLVLASCLIFVIPQIALSVEAMNRLPQELVNYLNPTAVDKDSWAVFFIAGLAVFFYNAMSAFLKGPIAKHLAMLLSDFREEGLTWKLWRYMRTLLSQHVLLYGSLVVGGFSVPPFEYIFARGLEGLETMSLSTVASKASDLLNMVQSIHLLLTYFVATLIVASVFHHIGKNMLNWLELGGYVNWIMDPSFRNLKTSTLNLLHDVEAAVQEVKSGSAKDYVDYADRQLDNKLYALSFYQASVTANLLKDPALAL